MKGKQVGQFLRMLFLHNWHWKLFSLVIAVLVHFSIREDIITREVTVAVEAVFDAANTGKALESLEPRSVRVKLRGSYDDINKLDTTQMRCVLRYKQRASAAKDNDKDKVKLRIRNSNLRGMGRVRIVKIEPDEATLKFDEPLQVELAVDEPRVQGKARGRVELEMPPTKLVLVKGSKRTLGEIDATTARVQTEAIDVEGRSESFNQAVKLYPPGGALNAVVEPAEIQVTVKIISEKSTAKLEQVPVMVVQPVGSSMRWSVEPAVVEVEMVGRAEDVKSVMFGQIVATVNGNIPITPGSVTNEVPVLLHVEQGVKVDEVKSQPGRVKLIPMEAATVVVPNGG